MDHQAFIFVSYSHNNASDLNTVVDMLDQIPMQTWVDRSGLAGGDRWREEIRLAIQGSALFLLVATPQSLASPEVQKEYLYAQEQHKDILLVTFNRLHTIPDEVAKYPVVHLPSLGDKALYTLLYEFYELGAYPTPSGRFDPYLVLALVFHQHAPPQCQIRRVTKLWVARRWFVALSPLLVLLGIVGELNAHYLSGITDVPILGGVALALFIPMAILWLVTIVVALAASPILPSTTPPYVLFNFRGLLGYRDKLRMLRKLYFPEVAVVSDNGFVMHIHRPNREGRFDVIEIDFSEALAIDTQKTWTFGVKLVVTFRDGISRRFVLSRRFGRPRRLTDAIVNAFVAHQQQVVRHVPHAAAQKRQQEVIPVHRHLPSGLQAADTMPIVICHTAETTNIAQTLEAHLKGRVRVLTWNLSANRADTLPPQSCGVIFIADKVFQGGDAVPRLFASTHAQNVFVIPIKAQKSAPSPTLNCIGSIFLAGADMISDALKSIMP
jgi:TIR domain